jgi:hypothetical protein
MKNRARHTIFVGRLLCCLMLATLSLCASAVLGQNNTIFGPNVYIFFPSTPVSTINSTLATLAGNAQFSTNRYAVFFESGTYSGVESQVGYYMSVAGLGEEPTATAITNGYLTVNTTDSNGNLTTNFWRSLENMEMSLPSEDVEQWGVSQGADFRRMDINDSVELTNTNCGEASGGFIGDSVITGDIESCSQQQWQPTPTPASQLRRLTTTSLRQSTETGHRQPLRSPARRLNHQPEGRLKRSQQVDRRRATRVAAIIPLSRMKTSAAEGITQS